MNIYEKYKLPFVNMSISYGGNKLKMNKVLLDTGSASTILNADLVEQIGVIPEGEDIVDVIRGVGGVEYVYTKTLESVTFDEIVIKNFQVEIGMMDYGMDIDGIIGYDFMKHVGLIIDIPSMRISIRE